MTPEQGFTFIAQLIKFDYPDNSKHDTVQPCYLNISRRRIIVPCNDFPVVTIESGRFYVAKLRVCPVNTCAHKVKDDAVRPAEFLRDVDTVDSGEVAVFDGRLRTPVAEVQRSTMVARKWISSFCLYCSVINAHCGKVSIVWSRYYEHSLSLLSSQRSNMTKRLRRSCTSIMSKTKFDSLKRFCIRMHQDLAGIAPSEYI